MPSQAPLLVVPPAKAQVPGALNLNADELTGDMIVFLAVRGSQAAQTTLDQLQSWLGGMARVDLPLVIPAAANTPSNTVNLIGGAFSSLILPPGFQPTTLTLLGSEDGVNFFPVYATNNAPWSLQINGVVAAPGRLIQIPEPSWVHVNYLQMMSSGAQGAPQPVVLVSSF